MNFDMLHLIAEELKSNNYDVKVHDQYYERFYKYMIYANNICILCGSDSVRISGVYYHWFRRGYMEYYISYNDPEIFDKILLIFKYKYVSGVKFCVCSGVSKFLELLFGLTAPQSNSLDEKILYEITSNNRE
jgi:hypothetical protein